MSVDQAFGIPIYQTNVFKEYDDDLHTYFEGENRFIVMENEDQWAKDWAEDGGLWTSQNIMPNILATHENYQPLYEDIFPRVQDGLDVFGATESALEIRKSWLCVMNSNQYAPTRTHPWSAITGVLFLFHEEDSGKIHFTNPFSYDCPFDEKKNSPYTRSKVFEPTHGDLFMFPSTVPYRIGRNRSTRRSHFVEFTISPKSWYKNGLEQ